jgi:hypothetical protein
MHNALIMKVADSHTDLGSIKLHNVFAESLLRLKNFVELASFDKGHYEVEALRRLEQVVHTDKERVVAAKKNIFFKLGVLDLIVFNENILADCFNGIEFLFFYKFSKEDFTKGTTSKQHFKLKVLILHIVVLTEANQH